MQPKLYKYSVLAILMSMTGCANLLDTDSRTVTGTRQVWDNKQRNYDYYCENSNLEISGNPLIEVNGTSIGNGNLKTVKINPGDMISLEYKEPKGRYTVLCIPKQLTGFIDENSDIVNKQPFPILGTLYAEPVDGLYVPWGYRYITDTNGTYLWYTEMSVDKEIDTFTDYTKIDGELVPVSFSLKQIKEKYILPDLFPVYAALSFETFVVIGYERVPAKLAEDNRPTPRTRNSEDSKDCAPQDIESIEYATRARLLTVNSTGDILNVIKVEDSLGWMFNSFTFLDNACSLGMDSVASITLYGEDTVLLTPRSYPWGVVAMNIETGKVVWKLDGNDNISLGNPPEYWTSAPAYAKIADEHLLVYDNSYSRGESRAIVLPIVDGQIGSLKEGSKVTTKLQCGNIACISVYGGSVENWKRVENLLITTGMVIRTTEYMAGEILYVPGQIALVESGLETWRVYMNNYSVMTAIPLTNEDIINFQ